MRFLQLPDVEAQMRILVCSAPDIGLVKKIWEANCFPEISAESPFIVSKNESREVYYRQTTLSGSG